jgi:signal recognition particle receptor subunit beta
MALVNDIKKEIHAKIVFFGPGGGGKTTNLEFIYSKLKPEYRGKFKFMNTPSGRIVFFDFMRPELAGIKDFSIRFHIYTVPGDVADVAIWKNVLKGADGVVFVADLEPARILENLRSLESLKEILRGYGTALEETPCLIQCNKKDVADASSIEQIQSLLDTADFRMVPASARSGEGVLPTLSEMVKMVLQKLRDLPIASEEEVPVVSVEPATVTPELVEEAVAPAIEPEEEAPALVVESLEEPIAQSIESIEAAALSTEPAVESVPLDITEEMPEELLGEEITADMIVDEPVGMVSEAAEVSGIGMSSEAFPLAEQVCAPATSEPEIEVAGEIVAIGTGRFRLPLVIRLGDREVKTALSLDVSFEKPGLS